MNAGISFRLRGAVSLMLIILSLHGYTWVSQQNL